MSFYLKTTINNKTVVSVLLFLLLFFDAFAGPLRYFLSLKGLEIIAYLPKLACLLFVFSEIVRIKVKKNIFQVLIFTFPFVLIGLLYSISLLSVLFTVLLISPLLFGLVAAKYIRISEFSFFSVIIFFFIMTAIGVYLDVYLDFPWKGFTYNIGGSEIETSREWGYLGLDRPAGFTRMSAVAAFYLLGTGVFVIGYISKWYLKLVFFIITFVAILATTNKAALLGFLIAIMAYFLKGEKKINIFLRNMLVYSLALMTVVLPLSTQFIQYEMNLTDPINYFLFASFDMRLVDTWPQYIAGVSEYGNYITGVGFGGSGSANKYFADDKFQVLSVADNLALYLYGWFGLFSVLMIFYFSYVSLYLFDKNKRVENLLAVVLVAMLSVSITTDIIEAPIFSFMLGLSIGFVTQDKNKVKFI